MKGDKNNRGTWSRREVFRVGSMATAAGAMGGIAVTDAAPAPQAPAVTASRVREGIRRSTRGSACVRSST